MGGVFLFSPHGIHNLFLTLLIVGVSFAIAYFLWQILVTGKTEWTVSDTEINMVWKKSFPFANSEDIIIKWSEVKNIRRGADLHYYNLKIDLVSGKAITLYHDTLTTGDDFQECLKALYSTLENKKRQSTESLA